MGAIASWTDQEWRTYSFASAATRLPSSVFASTIATGEELIGRRGYGRPVERSSGEPRRDRRRRLADDDRDLLPVRELDAAWIAGVPLAVDEHAHSTAVAADTRPRQTDAPLGEELPETVRMAALRFRVQDPRVVMRVQRRDAPLHALPNAAVRHRCVRQ